MTAIIPPQETFGCQKKPKHPADRAKFILRVWAAIFQPKLKNCEKTKKTVVDLVKKVRFFEWHFNLAVKHTNSCFLSFFTSLET